MSGRSVVSPTRNSVQPSAFQAATVKVAQELEALRYHMQNRLDGCLVLAPTTPSAQAAGIGNTTWSVDIGDGIKIVNAVALNQVEQADLVVHAGSLLAGLTVGRSCIAAIVAYGVSGTLLVVKGTPAVTGTQVAPTDAEIQTAVDLLTPDAPWVKLGESTINRTLDTTVTQTYDNTVRPLLAVNQDAGFGDWSAIS
jgi:hypothetical protein